MTFNKKIKKRGITKAAIHRRLKKQRINATRYPFTKGT